MGGHDLPVPAVEMRFTEVRLLPAKVTNQLCL